MNYYNENDPKAAAWLRELIKEGHIAPGVVDERSIVAVDPDELNGYAQCHFFAGIGGWSFALRIAGIPDDYPIWTGSCPCQPLSGAGLRKGHADERHLWPAFHALIAKRRPAKVFGEQVASADGREWFAGIRADLEGMGYACGGADLCAAGVGSPHIRQRLYWVADSDEPGRQGQGQSIGSTVGKNRQTQPRSISGGMAHADSQRGCGGQSGRKDAAHAWKPGEAGNFWSNYDLLPCADGKSRRVESGTFPLAHGVPGRVGLLRGYGNAINPWQAALFIRAAMNA